MMNKPTIYKFTFLLALLVLLATVFSIGQKNSADKALAVTAPELPRVYIDTTYPTQSSSRTIYNVKTNCSAVSNCFTSLQTAINTANQGDEIIVQAGMEILGPI